jgi:filamentous hemagglutinin family protein
MPAMPKRVGARLLTCVSAYAFAAGAGLAQAPEGGVVASGEARIAQDAARSVVSQRSERAVIDWKSFDVGPDHHVAFDQPGRGSATLNRVGSGARSVIEGGISAPGTVIIQNGAGVLFTEGARVDVGSLVATTHAVDAGYFARTGNLSMQGGGRPGARVVNRGDITVGEAGLAALVGRDVENAGAIVAHRGTVALASGTRTAIDFAGDGVFQIAVEGAPGGGAVSQTGRIEADGGRVLLTAGGASGALDGVINTSGLIRASSSVGTGGQVELVGRGNVRVELGGRVEAGGEKGGDIAVTGREVDVLDTARLDASGTDGGGRIRVGGDFQGVGRLAPAEVLTVQAGARLSADGGRGAGGTIVMWSDGQTRFDGTASATGDAGGGLVETSGKIALGIGSHAGVDLGWNGRWLLDPRHVEITRGGLDPVPPGQFDPPVGSTVYEIDAAALSRTLEGGADVTVTTTNPPEPAENGDIRVRAPVSWSSSATLTLDADDDVRIFSPIAFPQGNLVLDAVDEIQIASRISTVSGDFVATAGDNIFVTADQISATGPGTLRMTSVAGPIEFRGNASQNQVISTNTGSLTIDAGADFRLKSQTNVSKNARIESRSGPISVTSGTQIAVLGGTPPAGSGNWARIQGGGAVTLDAPSITVEGGAPGGNFAAVGATSGGSLTLRGDEIAVLDAGSPGRVQTSGGAPLTLDAPLQTWDGLVASGTGTDDGGSVVLEGAVTATVEPLFVLAPGASFSFGAESPSSYASSLPLAVTTRGGTTGAEGTISLEGPVTAERVLLVSERRVAFGPDVAVTGTGPGDAVVVAAGQNFDNAAGPEALVPADPGARWLLYVDTFAGLTGAEPSTPEFDLYDRAYALTPPGAIEGFAGNRIVYAEQPVLTLTANDAAKTYGGTTGLGFTAAGLRPKDALAIALADGPAVASPGSDAEAPAGTYPVGVTATASAQGYEVVTVDGLLDVTPAPLSVVAADAEVTEGQPLPAFGAAYTGFVLDEGPEVLAGVLAVTTPATSASPPGTYPLIPDGVASPNYAISFVPGTLTVVADTTPPPGGGGGTPPPGGGGGTPPPGGGGGTPPPGGGGGTPPPGGGGGGTPPPGGGGGTPPGGGGGDGGAIALPGLGGTATAGAEIAAQRETFVRGTNPFTPGDAAFRTTSFDAPPAIAEPFALTYSLGEVVQAPGATETGLGGFVPAAATAPGTGGFVPAAAGLDDPATGGFVPAAGDLAAADEADGAAAGCPGPINVGIADDPDCLRATVTESFWATREAGQ